MGLTPCSLSKVAQIAFKVADVPAATAYYRDVLGMQLLFEVSGMAFFNCGGVRLMLGPAERADDPETIVYYQVDDLPGTVAGMKERGAKFFQEPHRIAEMPDHDLWLAIFNDLEGRMIGILSEVRG